MSKRLAVCVTTREGGPHAVGLARAAARVGVGEVRELPLHRGEVDYDQLVAEIFKSDRVIAWW